MTQDKIGRSVKYQFKVILSPIRRTLREKGGGILSHHLRSKSNVLICPTKGYRDRKTLLVSKHAT